MSANLKTDNEYSAVSKRRIVFMKIIKHNYIKELIELNNIA